VTDVGREMIAAARSLELQEKDQDKEEEKRDKLEGKADKLEKKLDGLTGKIDKLEKKADKLEPKLDKLEKKYDKMEAKLDKIEKKLDKPKDKKDGKKGAMKVTVPAAFLRSGDDHLAGSAVALASSRALSVARSRVHPLRWLLGVRGQGVRLADETEKDLDERESNLDKAEEIYDKEEENLDKLENIMDKLENIYDTREKNVDAAEKEFDKAEEALDRTQTSPRGGSRERSMQERPGRRGIVRTFRPLSHRRGARAVRAEIAGLLRMLEEGGSAGKRAARRLEQIGSAATPALCRAYDSPAEHFRWQIVNLLGYTRDPRALGLLAHRGIHDPELHPRWRSIWALTSVDDGSAARILRAQVTRNSGLRRRHAAVALSLFRDPAAVPVLCEGLRAEDPWIRWESASCLVGYADPAAARRIVRVYPHERDASVRRELVRAVSGVKDPAVLKFLRRRLAGADPQVRSAAAHALTLSLNGQSQPILLSHLAREQMPSVRREIREMLAALPKTQAG